MTHASLFSGIGGFDLSAQWMGWENLFQVEIDDYCHKVLAKNFPNVKRYGDIKLFNGKEWTGKVDVLTGGFPCQSFSTAGKRKGTEDNRYLWPEMLRVIKEVRPSFIVGENVYGLVNWSRGMVFDQVQADLENEGYQVAPVVLPACAVNAPHRRDRIWFVAHSNSTRVQRREASRHIEGEWEIQNELAFGHHQPHDWFNFPTQSPVCGRNDGISNRVDRLKALGNAIVPQVAFEIFKAIDH